MRNVGTEYEIRRTGTILYLKGMYLNKISFRYTQRGGCMDQPGEIRRSDWGKLKKEIGKADMKVVVTFTMA